MHAHTHLDLSAIELNDLIEQRLAEIGATDPTTAALLLAVSVHLRLHFLPAPSTHAKPPMKVRTLQELQPVVASLRSAHLREANWSSARPPLRWPGTAGAAAATLPERKPHADVRVAAPAPGGMRWRPGPRR